MGCGDTKEKLEDQMMKMKMSRIELQMERMKALQALKEMDGKEMKRPIIPDYIDQKFLQQQILKRQNSSSTLNQDMSPRKSLGSRRTLMPKRNKSTKSLFLKRKSIKEVEHGNINNRNIKKRTTLKKKTLKV